MRKIGITFGLLLALTIALALAWPRTQRQLAVSTTAHAAVAENAALPVVMVPEPTSTSTPVPTATVPTSTNTPTESPTPLVSPTPVVQATATSEPLPGNAVTNGSFEDGWTDLPPAPGFLINQQPNGWSLTWLDIGQPLWDDPATTVQGIPEALHKLLDQLPPDEQPGGPNPLILDGVTTYKMFHFGAPFGSQLYQVVANLPPGSSWRFTVPIQVHAHDDMDPWAAESGVWALTSATQAGGWTPAGEMGDRQWFRHNVEFSVPADGRVELVIRVKSKWFRAKDFFIDHVELRRLNTSQVADYTRHPEIEGGNVTWGPRLLTQIPARELVRP